MRKNILITGASSGLGKEMARQYAAMGRNLVLCARRRDALQALASELTSQYPDIKVQIRALDVNEHEQVFTVFHSVANEFGKLDRVIVNAGIGKGGSIGKGFFNANRQTAETNFVAALAQCEAAMEIFRQQNDGHLVTISSVSSVRGFRGAFTTYAATKAGLASLTEGIRIDVLHTPISVTTIHPGYIDTEIIDEGTKPPFMVDVQTGCRSIIKAIEKEVDIAYVPFWPWALLRHLLAWLPLGWMRRFS
ncbi:SDR family oxidoreductase [Thalassotalea mangrovi]|uniref:SDR family oxidoreductase n=1 Tax=Thalassotalea mangrovi TaxID=2572245 RepID=A0A4V5NUL6_9GAMM|nr:SDR family oxidoreductase [Thalassotalea mangrovi]TKB46894.1 SDR family oxidoreductase [Thalassotalea mangrovi]